MVISSGVVLIELTKYSSVIVMGALPATKRNFIVNPCYMKYYGVYSAYPFFDAQLRLLRAVNDPEHPFQTSFNAN
jgi:hypothetical protein